MDRTCDTRYPLLLVHGTGFRDSKKSGRYWGRIPMALADRGATVFYGHQDSWGTVEDNAVVIGRQIDRILADTGCERVNIFAHSKGGLDARYMISSLGYADRVASLTTVSTPHHGSRTMDALLRLPVCIFKIIAFFVNGFFRLVGDRKPDFHAVCRGFTTAGMAAFNEANPDADGVYYQSVTACMTRSTSDVLMALTHFVVKRFDGDNDGLVAVESGQWADFRGVWRTPVRRGISHADAVDMRRRNFSRKPFEGINDIREEYAALTMELKDRGL